MSPWSWIDVHTDEDRPSVTVKPCSERLQEASLSAALNLRVAKAWPPPPEGLPRALAQATRWMLPWHLGTLALCRSQLVVCR